MIELIEGVGIERTVFLVEVDGQLLAEVHGVELDVSRRLGERIGAELVGPRQPPREDRAAGPLLLGFFPGRLSDFSRRSVGIRERRGCDECECCRGDQESLSQWPRPPLSVSVPTPCPSLPWDPPRSWGTRRAQLSDRSGYFKTGSSKFLY